MVGGASGCAMSPGVSGFKPMSPPVVYRPLDRQLEFVAVGSLRPTLQWSPFPGGDSPIGWGQTEDFVAVDSARVSRVSYDVRIWQVVKDEFGPLVYERQSLAATAHQVEQPLCPSTRYFWSVRARFDYEGNSRVTEWSLSMIPWLPGPSPRAVARRFGRIPPANAFRFATPAGPAPDHCSATRPYRIES
jgi:hypothetical protein